MNKLFTICFISFIMFTHVATAQSLQSWRPGEQQIKIITVDDVEKTEDAMHALKASYSIGLSISYEEADGFIRCYVTPEELNFLREQNLKIEIEVDDLNKLSASFGSRGVPTGYYTVAELNQIADSLATNFPDICTKHLIGTSSANHQMFALKISDNSAIDENEPELLFDGGIHGDEIGGPENLIRFARDLCTGYGTDEEITFAVDSAEIWIIYCLNPYGRDNMTRYNANFIDLNRDCGYMWNSSGNSLALFSQPETKVLRNVLTEHQFVIHNSLHSGIEFVSYPWSYRQTLTPDDANHSYLAQQYSINSGYLNLPYGPGFSGMYAINGSTKDFGYGATGAISWSVEISMNKQPPASQIGLFYLNNKSAMLSIVNHAINQGINGIITDSITGEPLAATVFVSDLFPINTSALTGDYHKFLVPGSYSLRVEATGYLTQTISDFTVNQGEQTTINVQMIRGGRYFVQSLISCQIPNNNPEDEGNTPAVIGKPDTIAYSIGRNGLVVVDMGTAILNRTGNDIKVYESDDTPEGYNVYASENPLGPWSILGTGNGTTSFDLSATFLSKARYIKITDDGDGSSQVPDAGFDLDAVENLHPDTLTVGWVSGITYNDQEPYFVIPGAIVTINENEVISNENGEYIIACVPGDFELSVTAPYYYGIDTVTIALGDTLIHSMYLSLTESTQFYKDQSGFSVYPVPATDYLTLQGPSGGYLIEIYNMHGIKLDEANIYVTANGYIYQTSRFLTGLYFMRIYDNEQLYTIKFIKGQ